MEQACSPLHAGKNGGKLFHAHVNMHSGRRGCFQWKKPIALLKKTSSSLLHARAREGQEQLAMEQNAFPAGLFSWRFRLSRA